MFLDSGREKKAFYKSRRTVIVFRGLANDHYLYRHCCIWLILGSQIYSFSCVMSNQPLYLIRVFIFNCGPGSSVGIATELRVGRSGIESRWERDFPPVQTGPGAHQASCKMGTGSFLGVKCGRGVLLTTHPLLVPRSWKSTAIPLPTLWVTPRL